MVLAGVFKIFFNCKFPYTYTHTQSGSIFDNRRRCVAVLFYQDTATFSISNCKSVTYAVMRSHLQTYVGLNNRFCCCSQLVDIFFWCIERCTSQLAFGVFFFYILTSLTIEQQICLCMCTLRLTIVSMNILQFSASPGPDLSHACTSCSDCIVCSKNHLNYSSIWAVFALLTLLRLRHNCFLYLTFCSACLDLPFCFMLTS